MASLRSPRTVGVVDACAAAALYAIGWGRAFSFDASRTVAHFVTAPSIGDVFGQDRFNNHPLFSFLDHLVHVLTGSDDERVLRLLPIVCGAAAVGLVAAAIASRFGWVAGHVAGATLAVNAMAIRQFREVRGYALVTLAAVVASLLLFRLLDGDRRWSVAGGYVVAVFVAIGTHLFAVGLVALHALVVIGSRAPLARWAVAWAAAGAAGLAVQWPALVDGLGVPPTYLFAPAFPIRLAANLLGGPAAPGVLILVVAGWTVLRTRPWLSWTLAGTAAMVVAAWLAGPSWLDSRFFIWLIPATAVAAGAAVSRWPRLAVLAVACIAVQLAVLGRDLRRSEVPNRIAAAFVRRAQVTTAFDRVCALGRTRAGLLAYVDDVRVVWHQAAMPTCDLAVEAAGPRPQPLIGPACERFPFVLELPAKHPGALFAEQPLSDDQGWTSTASSPICT